MKIYALTREGRRVAKTTSQAREEILDRLYPNRTAPYDELLQLDKDARLKIKLFVGKGLMEEVDA